MIEFHPWGSVGPAGAKLVVSEAVFVGAGLVLQAEVDPHGPPCPFETHETVWTGLGFPQHPSVVVLVCVRCWNTFTVEDRGEQ